MKVNEDDDNDISDGEHHYGDFAQNYFCRTSSYEEAAEAAGRSVSSSVKKFNISSYSGDQNYYTQDHNYDDSHHTQVNIM